MTSGGSFDDGSEDGTVIVPVPGDAATARVLAADRHPQSSGGGAPCQVYVAGHITLVIADRSMPATAPGSA